MVAITMLMIVALSMQNAETSGATSKSQIEVILNAFLGEENVTEELVRSFQIPMRKLAHFGIYMLLGFALSNAFNNTFKRKFIYFAMVAGILYSFFDEFVLQRNSYGRGPSIFDVLIDSGGVIVGFGLYFLILVINNSIKKKQQA